MARAGLEPGEAVGTAAPHGRGRGDGGAGRRRDRARGRGGRPGAGQLSAREGRERQGPSPGVGPAAQASTQAALEQSEESRKQADAVSRFLVEAFRSPDPSEDGREMKVVDVLDRAVTRLDQEFAGSQVTRGALFQTLGTDLSAA